MEIEANLGKVSEIERFARAPKDIEENGNFRLEAGIKLVPSN